MGIKILVADDDPDIRLSLSERLRWLGHEVITAPDGQAALAAVRRLWTVRGESCAWRQMPPAPEERESKRLDRRGSVPAEASYSSAH